MEEGLRILVSRMKAAQAGRGSDAWPLGGAVSRSEATAAARNILRALVQ